MNVEFNSAERKTVLLALAQLATAQPKQDRPSKLLADKFYGREVFENLKNETTGRPGQRARAYDI